MKQLVSIIIPIFNGELYIDRCLISICSQTYKKIEVLLIDDGSTDGTKKKTEKWLKKDKRIKYIFKKNGGVSSARNLGIKKSMGDLIMFVDIDDWIPKNYVNEIIEAFRKDDSDVVITNYKKVYDDNHFNIGIENVPTKRYLDEILKNDGIMGFVFNKTYKKCVIKNHFFNEKIKIYEDLLLNVEMSPKIHKYSFLNNIYYNYYQNVSSVMHTKFITDLTRFNANKKIIKILIDNEEEELSLNRIYYYLWDYKKYNVNEKELNDFYKDMYKYYLRKGKLKNKVKLVIFNYFPKLYFKKRGM